MGAGGNITAFSELTGAQQTAVGAGAASGIIGALGTIEQGKARESQARINAMLAERNAEITMQRGKEATQRFRGDIRKLVGQQRASYAAQNVDISDMDSSAAYVMEETDELGEQDALNIQLNALREAFGYKMSALNQRAAGEAASSQALGQAAGTLLTTGAQTYNMWSQFGG
jgi:hypothetical protein